MGRVIYRIDQTTAPVSFLPDRPIDRWFVSGGDNQKCTGQVALLIRTFVNGDITQFSQSFQLWGQGGADHSDLRLSLQEANHFPGRNLAAADNYGAALI
jgi:hypothetical protein